MAVDPQAIANQIAGDWLRERIWRLEHPAPPGPAAVRAARARRHPQVAESSDDALRSVPPVAYVEALAGVEVPHSGTISCPLPGHEDRTPSFKVYRDPEDGVYCFGCNRGGDIYAFAGALWEMDWHRDFRELRRRLAAEMLRVWA
jgi:hypothetical protein